MLPGERRISGISNESFAFAIQGHHILVESGAIDDVVVNRLDVLVTVRDRAHSMSMFCPSYACMKGTHERSSCALDRFCRYFDSQSLTLRAQRLLVMERMFICSVRTMMHVRSHRSDAMYGLTRHDSFTITSLLRWCTAR